jgi:hypothetical protein
MHLLGRSWRCCRLASGTKFHRPPLQEYMEFRSGDMVTGLLDKAQFGSYGLVHSVQVCRFIDAVAVSRSCLVSISCLKAAHAVLW